MHHYDIIFLENNQDFVLGKIKCLTSQLYRMREGIKACSGVRERQDSGQQV